MKANFFTGEHSTVLINMNQVTYAKSESPSGGSLIVHFIDGSSIELSHGSANMFREQWRNLSNELTNSPGVL